MTGLWSRSAHVLVHKSCRPRDMDSDIFLCYRSYEALGLTKLVHTRLNLRLFFCAAERVATHSLGTSSLGTSLAIHDVWSFNQPCQALLYSGLTQQARRWSGIPRPALAEDEQHHQVVSLAYLPSQPVLRVCPLQQSGTSIRTG